MESDRPSKHNRSRRELLVAGAAGAVGAGVAIAAASGGHSRRRRASTRAATTEAQADIALLATLLDVERRSIAAYSVAAAAVRGRTLALIETFLAHEHEHANAVASAIHDLGATPPAAATAAQYASALPIPPHRRDALRLLLASEEQSLGAYVAMLPRLSTEEVRLTAAAIVGTEAEHMTVMSERLGRPALAGSFPTGSLVTGAP